MRKICQALRRLRVNTLLRGEVRALRVKQAVAIDEPETRARFLLRQTVGNHGFAEKVGYTNACGTGAEHNDLLIAKAAAGNTDGRKDRSAGDRSGALNIVIEGQELVAVAVEDGTSMGLREIFPLKQRMGQFLFQGLNETIDKIVIGIASDALVAPTQIFGISKALFIVGAHIENNGQR